MRSAASSNEPADLTSLALALATVDAGLVVWKGGGDLAAQGDLDCCAPRSAWPVLARAFENWAREQKLAATIACRHLIGQLVLVGCGGSVAPRLVQVDLVAELVVHGAPVWKAEDAQAASVSTAGVARMRPGAEGILRRLADRSDRRAVELVAADPSGAVLVSERLGVRGRLAAAADRDSSRLALEAVLAARPLLHLATLARALRSNAGRNECPVLRALRNERTLDEAVEPWLTTIAADHEVRRV
jgi:hypothetical protein